MLRRSRIFSGVTILQRGAPVSDASAVLKHVNVTEDTWKRLAYVNQRDNTPARPLRLKIVPGGCRGFTYEFQLQKTPEHFDDDIEFVNDSCVPGDCTAAAAGSSSLLSGALAPTPAATTTSGAEGKSPSTEKFIIDEISMAKLKGAEIAFVTKMSGMGFLVSNNSNVDKSCACKMSFSMRGSED